MQIPSTFQLDLPPDNAYELLLDLDRVAPCLPGATLGDELADGGRELTVAVRLGPMKFQYTGSVRIAERDGAARRAVLVGTAREMRGQGDANATITMNVSPNGDRSQVDSVADIDLSGRAGQAGRGIVEDVSRRMIDEMTACLRARASEQGGSVSGRRASPAPDLAAAESGRDDASPIRAGALAMKVIWDRLRRLFRRAR